MLTEVNRAVAPLRSALEADNWKALGVALHKISTTCTTANGNGNGNGNGNSPGAVSSETIRVATDILIDECAFGTAFERAYVVRRALHGVGVGKWLYTALMHVNPASPVSRRLVTLVECLATTEVGRGHLGRHRVIHALVSVWNRSFSSTTTINININIHSGRGVSNLPAALCALCSGHLDNIARLMRIGGIATILRALESATSTTTNTNAIHGVGDTKLLSNTLLLLGLICICVPDKLTSNSGANQRLVPRISAIIRSLSGAKRPNKPLLAHAINVVANIAECWRKEGAGFLIDAPCGDELLNNILRAWMIAPRNRQVANAAAWAITGLIRGGKSSVYTDIKAHLDDILSNSSTSISAVRALRKLLESHPVLERKPAKVTVKVKKTSITSKTSKTSNSTTSTRVRKRSRNHTCTEPVAVKRPRYAKKPSSPSRLDAFDFDAQPDSTSHVHAPVTETPHKVRRGPVRRARRLCT